MTEARQNGNTVKKVLLGLAIFVLILVLFPLTTVHAEEQIIDVGIPVEEHPELFITRSMPTHGEGKMAVFLIQFPDYMNDEPQATQEHYDKLYFSGGLDNLPPWGETTVAKFYEEQSYGKLKLSGQVFDWYTAKHERSYYDSREKKAELIIEAAEYYRAQGVDFSQFDGDKDGILDAVVYHFAGDATIDRYSAWYPGMCYSGGPEGFGYIDGLKFTTMVQLVSPYGEGENSVAFIGTVCHELMHTLGMPDLYSEIGTGVLNAIDLMSFERNSINPYTKMMLGWIENVKVITEDQKNIRLDVCEKSGDVALVTNEFTGLFDEFYLVAYRENAFSFLTTATVWYVDARLNEDGSAFRCQNISYNPTPGKDGVHDVVIGSASPYLFIEEISADPEINFIFDFITDPIQSQFTENSVLGPNHVPSSDTHDGEYTGIQIDSFERHEEDYLTFSVSFVEDTTPPTVKTENLEIKETVHVYFNENIYPGTAWDSIYVTDLNGNPIDVTVSRSYHERNEVEIIFKSDAYKSGYKLVIPQDAVRDSAGNKIEALTLTASIDSYLFALETTLLPGVGKYVRANHIAYFFPQENGIIIITDLWSTQILGTHVEFMHLDLAGNVIKQTIIENPFEGTEIRGVVKANSDSFIIFCARAMEGDGNSYVFYCIDSSGKIKWTNNTYEQVKYSINHSNSIVTDKGVIINYWNAESEKEFILVDPETGNINPLENIFNLDHIYRSSILGIDNDIFFTEKLVNVYLNDYILKRYIISTETFEVLVENSVDFQNRVESIHANGDGTYFALCRHRVNGDSIILMDSKLNVIKSMSLPTSPAEEQVIWLGNDGFCLITWTHIGDHENNVFSVSRYDRYMKFMWKMDIEADFVYYFKDSDSNILIYRAMWGRGPERKSYIDFCGSEEKYRTEHVHTLEHTAEIPAACVSEGQAEYWYCTECGVYFSDEGETTVTDPRDLILPAIGHTEVVDEAIAATCGKSGVTEGKHCSKCDEVLVAQVTIPATGEHVYDEWTATQTPTCIKTGSEKRECTICHKEDTRKISATGEHQYNEWAVSKEPTCVNQGTEKRECSTCNKVETREIPATGIHVYSEWVITKAATCAEAGMETRECTTCDKVENREVPATGNHVYGEWTVTEAATCVGAGAEARSCTTCDKVESREISATGNHVYGDWVVALEPTTKAEGEEIRTCAECDAKETRTIPMLPKDNTPIIVIAIGAVVALGGGAVFLSRRKKK